MFYLILAESALEPIPKQVARHPVVAREAEKRRKDAQSMLLDSSKHYPAMAAVHLRDSEKRGRPDIIHFCLSLALDSVLNKKGLLKVFIHTRNDEVITVSPQARLPRSFNRFCGLFEDLFEKKEIKIQQGEVLLKLEKKTLKQLLLQIECKNVLALDVGGEETSRKGLLKIFKDAEKKTQGAVAIIGGFPHGNFEDSSKALEKARRISVAQEELCAWTAESIILNSMEEAVLE